MAKLPGKTAYSGRRRTTTRQSGFHSHDDSTGGEHKAIPVEKVHLTPEQPLTLTFQFPEVTRTLYAGYGGYFRTDAPVNVSIDNPNYSKANLHQYADPDWSKFGSMWLATATPTDVHVTFSSNHDTLISFYDVSCGLIWHSHFDDARPAIMKSMHKLAPEGNFYVTVGEVVWPEREIAEDEQYEIHLKSCNRCARFLPINVHNERNHLAFSNHCVARAPCQHKGFGKLRDVDTNKEVQLHHGYQLECRFCKKYEVNAPLNPQRTAAQMKEDGQRRRHFELLITELYQMSPQLAYRHKTGHELVDDIWKKFNGHCFNCNAPLKTPRSMHLDHTRPLALLWPLDGTATALCATCNTQKRDRFPAEFYSEEQLTRLSEITNIPLQELKSPDPDHEVIRALLEKIDWFYDEFLTRPDLTKERDGKVASELVVKALDKVLARSSIDYAFSFVSEYKRRRKQHSAIARALGIDVP